MTQGGAIPWLVVLRWAAVLGQLACIGAAKFVFHWPLRWEPLLLIVFAVAVSNAVLQRQRPHSRKGVESVVGSVLLFDTVALTGLLFFSAGVFNPFTVMYLVHITLSAVVLPSRWTWGIAVLSMACFAALFQWTPDSIASHEMHGLQEHEAHHGRDASPFSAHLLGMWFAFCIAAALISVFVHHIKRALADQQSQLDALREAAGKAQHLASLTTLVAGAAHELGTPLGTISLAATEMKRHLTTRAEMGDRLALRQDAELIVEQTARCRAIIDRMAYRAGQDFGAMPEWVAVGEIVEWLQARFPSTRVQWWSEFSDQTDDHAHIHVARTPLLQSLSSLVTNALDATEHMPAERSVVQVRIASQQDSLVFEVRDEGEGMNDETLRQSMVPFFTTKEPGRGLGLGLFLVQTFAEQSSAAFTLDSHPGRGTVARLVLAGLRVGPLNRLSRMAPSTTTPTVKETSP
jgi:two-component system sensor histidine kinase RegB